MTPKLDGKYSRVMVSLGDPKEADGPMPATVFDWPCQRKVKFQYIRPEHLALMGKDTSALWWAEFVDGLWWLEKRVEDAPVLVAV